jgi:hypothetical protein
MGYDPIGNMLSGTTPASIDPLDQQQAYEQNEQLQREEEERRKQEELVAQQEAQAAEQQKQQQEAQSANPIAEIGTAAVGGMVDFVDDTVEAVGTLGGQDWEFIPEDWGPQNKTEWGKGLRSIVSFIGPTIGIGSLTKAGILQVAKMAKYANTSKAVAMLGNIGVDMAAGTAVDYLNRNSEGDNLIRVLKDNLPQAVGWIPEDWATLDSDSPDIKRNKNVMEGAGLGLLASALEGSIAWAKALKGKAPGVTFKPKDDTAKAAFDSITNKSPQTKSAHPFLDRILKDENYRQQHIDEMGQVELDQIGGIDYLNYYSPNIHSQISDTYETIPHAVKPDAIPQMLVDNWRITENIDTLYGRPQKFHTDAFLKSMDLDQITSRKLVTELDNRIKETGNFEVVLPNGRMADSKELMSAGDKLAMQLLDPRIRPTDMYKILDGYRDSIKVVMGAGRATPLDSEAQAAAGRALSEFSKFFLNMDADRASAYWKVALAGESSDLANAARVVGEEVDVAQIQERILDKMQVLWYETDMSSSIAGWRLNNEKIWQETLKSQSPDEAAKFAKKTLDEFKAAQKLKAERKRLFWTELKTMNKEHPAYVSPLMRAYELSDGDVNSLHKLNNYMAEVLGITNKAFIDGKPEVPSQVVQGMWAALYNAKLSSLLTPVKALTNNFALLLMKPANVALGAIIRQDWQTLHRGWMQYATHMDTTMKASGQYMQQMFRKVAADPTITQRADFKTLNNEMLELAREYANAEALKGNHGPAFKMQFVDTMQKINNHPWVRYSMNIMEAGDGFVKATLAMSEARGRAYDEILKATGKAPNADQLQEAAQKIYRTMFDDNDVLTDSAAKYASQEISMSLDNEYAESLNKLLSKAPILKTVVLFPRTSVNVLDFVHKHSPLSYFIGDLQKVRQLSGMTGDEKSWAQNADAVAQYLATKGIDVTKQPLDQAWKTYRAEVEGRVAMGTALVTMGGWMYASGNLTGNGSYNKQTNKFQQNFGERPLRSWRTPTGQWVSYDGVEPIATFLALTADVLENINTLGTTKSEQLLNKLGFAVSMNLTNKSFLQGLQPIAEMASGNGDAINRWASNTMSVGLFNQMSRMMMPGLREVDSDLGSMMRNKWNILDAVGIGKSLPYAIDPIDGSKVGYNDPFTNALNNTLPFKINSDPSPVKQFLIDSEFPVQPAFKTSLKGVAYNAEQRARLAQIMGEAGHLRTGLELLMKDKRVLDDIKNIKAMRDRGITSEQADLADTYTHIRIKRLITQTVNHAKRQLASEIPEIRQAELAAAKNRRAQGSRDYSAINMQNK